ncbi:hypothetical protein LHK_02428 [Laribacter hongkongensis HLHK9]|uniref:Uncharacterized protein n=1 Tax=Laribacter hongkongensis (strain HLHK9) TaxID=557598 RepID=C1DB71_LARHH|nr:hypothetical protein LHK_02428 [Laribacter hongkongensis HLHK9]
MLIRQPSKTQTALHKGIFKQSSNNTVPFSDFRQKSPFYATK